MKSFEYAAPKTVKEATALLSEAWGKTEILAGGTDLVTSLKQRLTQPDRVVSLKNIKDLRGIRARRSSLTIGAMTTLGEVAEHADAKKQFPSLVTAIKGIGSPQLISVGTVGGDLCQRPRCWYYRNGFGLLGQHSGSSLVREGDNRYHAIFGTDGPALFVSASSLAPALIALGAEITVAGPGGKERTIRAAEFFRAPKMENERETALQPNEILTEISIPNRGMKNATYEIRHRGGLDWPYVTASVAFGGRGGNSDASVVLGHVAATPWLAASAGRALTGARVDEALAAKCGEAATEGARPLSQNAYKVQMVKAAVKRAVLAAAAA
ncbi:MAG: FAD binding domain-containing protein [Verrucomicrobiales bacterium]|nr:FAD binding domain-containing protein [Verrucomicrobiales bacterium]